jgi:phospholipase C
MKENRSFDEYFGRFPGADGATTGVMSNGQVVQLAQTPDPMPNDIAHNPIAWELAYDGGGMDGFDLEAGAFSKTGQPLAYSQMSEAQIPSYWAYARRYALGDRMFADWKGWSFGNNLFMVAAQAGREDENNGNRSVWSLPASSVVPKLNTWGCDNTPDTLVTMIDPDGGLSSQFPCFHFRSLPNVLQTYRVPWRFYADPQERSFQHNALDSLSRVRYSPALWQNVQPVTSFYADAAAGTLPAVSWLLGAHVEHPPESACDGENETVRFVNAIMRSPNWSSTMIVIAWDEWGGFYDHVRPPSIDNVSFGFRVPLIVISPWTRMGTSSAGGYVDHTFYSFGSILKFVEDNWGLPSLNTRDAGSSNMMSLFDFSGPHKGRLIRNQRTCAPLPPALERLAATQVQD